jgi:hypothetical protein
MMSEFDEESRIYAIPKNGLILRHFETDNELEPLESSAINFMHE